MAKIQTVSFTHVLNTTSYINDTLKTPVISQWWVTNVWMWKTAGTSVLLLGTFGNTMSILTFRQGKGTTTTSSIPIYLTTLAVTDTLALYFGTGYLWVRMIFGVDIALFHDWVCKLVPWVLNFSTATSSWVLVAMTVQRAASVVFPHRVNVVCTPTRTKIVVAGTVSVLAGLYSHMLYGVGLARGSCGPYFSPAYLEFWLKNWVNIDLAVYSLLPLGFIVISNCVLIHGLFTSATVATATLTSQSSEHHATYRRKQASSSTVTIVVVSVMFLVLSCPLLIFNTVSNIHGSGSMIADPHELMFYYNLCFLFTSSNLAVNFYLYCLTGTKFRRRFLNMFSSCFTQMIASRMEGGPSSCHSNTDDGGSSVEASSDKRTDNDEDDF